MVLKAARTVLEKICPRFAVTIRSRVQQCLERRLASVVPNAEDEAVVKAIESLDSLEWSDWIQLMEQLCNPDVQSLLKALQQQRGCEGLETTDPNSFCFAVIQRLCFGGSGSEFIEVGCFQQCL